MIYVSIYGKCIYVVNIHIYIYVVNIYIYIWQICIYIYTYGTAYVPTVRYAMVGAPPRMVTRFYSLVSILSIVLISWSLQ